MSIQPEIEFIEGDPPYTGGPITANPYYLRVAEALRARPGEWAVLKDNHPSNMAAAIRKGQYAAFRPEGHFLSVSRDANASGSSRIFIKYDPYHVDPEWVSIDARAKRRAAKKAAQAVQAVEKQVDQQGYAFTTPPPDGRTMRHHKSPE